MTEQGWREAVECAAEQDEAKQALRDKGYGCTGMPWLDLVAEVPEAGT